MSIPRPSNLRYHIYTMEPTPTTQPTSRELATIGSRFAASIIDFFALIALFFILDFALGSNLSSSTNNATGLIYVLYDWIMVAQFGATLGKRAMGIEVLTTDGERPGWGTAFVRSFVSVISSLVFMFGYIWAFFNPQRQTWHDLAARTLVVRSVK